ncbi:hypothetical protein NC653_035442 [Populus alba x Populus x berolinensis]|uniref:Uncharacterized protein n=1 Tax=Populus alba x Populus x berolinensis TaxID=444605 RepID=A0AAD6PXB8_9ROSI|nr:hypothetical protein NC653_035442 [Populus alba x Populus x berolinensis]
MHAPFWNKSASPTTTIQVSGGQAPKLTSGTFPSYQIVLENPYSPRLMDGCSEFCSFPVISIFLFSRRVTLIRNGRTMPIFLRHHCLSFLMTFAQPSIPDMFQH